MTRGAGRLAVACGALRVGCRAGIAAVLALGASACLDPVGSDRPGYSAELRSAHDSIDSVETDTLLQHRIDNNDGIDGDAVGIRSGFADGEPVRFWDFGTAPASIEPLWTFRRHTKDGGSERIDHYDLIDSIPGDSSYSPLRAIYVVYVTSAYDGERITSLRALEDAIELGLVEEPEEPDHYVDRPVALEGTQLPPLSGDAPPRTPDKVYYRGRIANEFVLGGEHERSFEIGMGPISAPNAYSLQRASESAVLDERVFKADLNDDGDQEDSNLVFSVGAGSERYTGLWSEVLVTVPDDYEFGASRAESDLFDKGETGLVAHPDRVVRWASSQNVLHLVLMEPDDETN